MGTGCALWVTIFLAACSILPGSKVPPLTVYRLPALPLEPAVRAETSRQLVVTEPLAGLSLDGRRVMVLGAQGKLRVLPGVVWADRPAAMLQSQLIGALAGSGQFAAVVAAGTAVDSDARLVSRLLDFQIETSRRPEARVQIAFSLVSSHGRVACQTRIDVRRPVPGKGSVAMVVALRKAAVEVVQRSRAWLSGDACRPRPAA